MVRLFGSPCTNPCTCVSCDGSEGSWVSAPRTQCVRFVRRPTLASEEWTLQWSACRCLRAPHPRWARRCRVAAGRRRPAAVALRNCEVRVRDATTSTTTMMTTGRCPRQSRSSAAAERERAGGGLTDAVAVAVAAAEDGDDKENGRLLADETTPDRAATEMMSHFVRCNVTRQALFKSFITKAATRNLLRSEGCFLPSLSTLSFLFFSLPSFLSLLSPPRRGPSNPAKGFRWAPLASPCSGENDSCSHQTRFLGSQYTKMFSWFVATYIVSVFS